jgi:5-methylthioadenosine/S-adenosylhomocysteine deaminase
LVNAHTHVLLLALRGTVEDMGAEAIYGYMSPISFAMNDDERRALALLGVARRCARARARWWSRSAMS